MYGCERVGCPARRDLSRGWTVLHPVALTLGSGLAFAVSVFFLPFFVLPLLSCPFFLFRFVFATDAAASAVIVGGTTLAGGVVCGRAIGHLETRPISTVLLDVTFFLGATSVELSTIPFVVEALVIEEVESLVPATGATGLAIGVVFEEDNGHLDTGPISTELLDVTFFFAVNSVERSRSTSMAAFVAEAVVFKVGVGVPEYRRDLGSGGVTGLLENGLLWTSGDGQSGNGVGGRRGTGAGERQSCAFDSPTELRDPMDASRGHKKASVGMLGWNDTVSMDAHGWSSGRRKSRGKCVGGKETTTPSPTLWWRSSAASGEWPFLVPFMSSPLVGFFVSQLPNHGLHGC